MSSIPMELFLSDEVQRLLDDFASLLDVRVTFFSAAGEFLRNIRPECVKLLPYHQMARMKYAGLGMEDTLPAGAEDLPARLEEATLLLQKIGLNAYHD